MVRKKDLITLCERHPDCEFLSFTNGTLIDEAFCKEMLRVKNFVPAISLEGFEQANDGRRGKGVFDKVMRAMDLLRSNKLPFGISTCYTSANYADISSEQFFDMMIEMGAMFVWFFHYMPVGNDAYRNFCLRQNRERQSMSVYGRSGKQNRYSVWISRMMRNMWVAVLLAAGITYISMQPGM